jgi:sigma-B regulation protein RsbU (phosphoserine phosphatase)
MTNFELLRMTLRNDDDAVALRHVAARTARLVHLDAADVTKVATSVSELGRLAQDYLPAELVVAVGSPPGGKAGVLVIELIFGTDRMPPLTRAIDATPMAAAALTAVGRLMDQTEVADDRIVISKLLISPLDAGEPAQLRDQLMIEPPGDLRAALRSQNEELVATLVALREREAELVRVNDELEQTNRGVVALYAQLEERAAQVRDAQRLVFEELEGALRPPAPTVAGVEFDVRYLPAQVNSPTGGDLYDWLVLPDGTLHITVVDVEGHGVQSTRDALLVTHAVRTLTLEGHRPDQLLTRTDELLRASKDEVRATALIARLDPRTGLLHLAGAGHPPALHVPVVDPPEYLPAPGRPIGYDGGGSAHLASFRLAPGDCVLLYTDGLVEVRHDIIEGLDTLVAAAIKGRGLPLPQLLDTVLAACTQGDPLEDDTMLLAIRWHPIA